MKPGGHRLRSGCIAFGLLLASCSTITSPSDATLANGVYNNRFFNFHVQIPKGWTVGSKEDFQMAGDAMKMDQQPGKEDKRIKEISHRLLLVSEKPAGTPAESNPAIVLVAVDLSGEKSTFTAEEYEQAVAQQLGNQSHWSQVSAPTRVRLGSKDFYRTDFELDVLGHKLYEAFFVTVEKRYGLLLMVTADSEIEVNNILARIGFPMSESR